MKVLVCKKKHCRGNNSENLLNKLKEYDVEFGYSSCMHMCESGPNIFTFPDLKMYGGVSLEKLDNIINSKNQVKPYDKEIYNLPENNIYRDDPMHRRTVKLFRWHLNKQEDFIARDLTETISFFKHKYDIKGTDFTYPISIALIQTIKGPDVPKLIQFLGREKTLELLDKHLKGIA